MVGLQLRVGLFFIPSPFFVFVFWAALYTSCVLSWSIWQYMLYLFIKKKIGKTHYYLLDDVEFYTQMVKNTFACNLWSRSRVRLFLF